MTLTRRHVISATIASLLPVGSAFAKNKPPTIGMLWHASSEQDEGSYFVEFMAGLREHGYREGDTIHVEHRYANEDYSRFPTQVAELIKLEVEILVASIRP